MHLETQKNPQQPITVGMSLPNEVIKTPDEFSVIIHFTEAEEKMVEELFALMGVSSHFLLDLAIKYALFYAKVRGVSIFELEEYPKKIGSGRFKLELMMESESRLEDAGLLDYIPGCAITGIYLLYNRLIKIQPKGQDE